MPKIDPITGCEVMTFFEFLGGEAEREGKDPADIMDEIARATAEDNANMEKFHRDPVQTLQALVEWTNMEMEDWEPGDPDWPKPHMPEEVLEVIDTTYSGGFGGSKTFILSRVRCEDGQERIAEFHHAYYSATRMEPEEDDGELLWHDSVEAYHSSVEQRKLDEIARKKRAEENHQRWLKERQ